MITKERASRLEGDFEKEKEHYRLRKIKARTKKNEILWIFFGIHTANALEIAEGCKVPSKKWHKYNENKRNFINLGGKIMPCLQ